MLSNPGATQAPKPQATATQPPKKPVENVWVTRIGKLTLVIFTLVLYWVSFTLVKGGLTWFLTYMGQINPDLFTITADQIDSISTAVALIINMFETICIFAWKFLPEPVKWSAVGVLVVDAMVCFTGLLGHVLVAQLGDTTVGIGEKGLMVAALAIILDLAGFVSFGAEWALKTTLMAFGINPESLFPQLIKQMEEESKEREKAKHHGEAHHAPTAPSAQPAYPAPAQAPPIAEPADPPAEQRGEGTPPATWRRIAGIPRFPGWVYFFDPNGSGAGLYYRTN